MTGGLVLYGLFKKILRNTTYEHMTCVFLMSRVNDIYIINIQERTIKWFNPNQNSFGCVLKIIAFASAESRRRSHAAMVTAWPIIGVTRCFVALLYLSPSIPV